MPKTIVHARESKLPSDTIAITAAAQPAEGVTEQARRRPETGASLRLSGLDDYERAFLATCQRIYRKDYGCMTPFEEFIANLVGAVKHGTWPSPEDVRADLETFERDWTNMRREAVRFIERYSEAVKVEAAPEKR